MPTAEQLNALPEMDYDSAYAYRDKLLAERSGKGAPLWGAVERSETEGEKKQGIYSFILSLLPSRQSRANSLVRGRR